MGAVYLTGYTLGHNTSNIATWAGKKLSLPTLNKFKGIDEYSGIIGDAIGSSVSRIAPEFSKRVTQHLIKKGIWLSEEQFMQLPARQKAGLDFNGIMRIPLAQRENLYPSALQDYAKYVGMDTLYTMITAVTVKPVINLARHIIPGLTYTEKPTQNETPEPRVSKIAHENTVSNAVAANRQA
jgi:hypothetical protein